MMIGTIYLRPYFLILSAYSVIIREKESESNRKVRQASGASGKAVSEANTLTLAGCKEKPP